MTYGFRWFVARILVAFERGAGNAMFQSLGSIDVELTLARWSY
jgi:hypothetical protein